MNTVLSKSIRLTSKKLGGLLLLPILLVVALSAKASNEPCQVNDEDSSLLKCYQSDFQEKFKANESKYRELVTQAKDQLQQAAQAEAQRQLAAYVEFIRKANHSVANERKLAAQECVRIASKFKSENTSVVAALNCRTDHEVQLGKQLRQLEFQLQVLTSQPQP
jgi:hypothetical protein